MSSFSTSEIAQTRDTTVACVGGEYSRTILSLALHDTCPAGFLARAVNTLASSRETLLMVSVWVWSFTSMMMLSEAVSSSSPRTLEHWLIGWLIEWISGLFKSLNDSIWAQQYGQKRDKNLNSFKTGERAITAPVMIGHWLF